MLAFFAMTIGLGVGLTLISINAGQTIWKFDAVVLGGFLLGDYPLRWVLGLRQNKTFMAAARFLRQAGPAPSWSRLAFTSAWFFIAVIAVGDAAYLVAWLTGLLYGGTLSQTLVLELSFLLSFWTSLDFLKHYRKDMGADDDFWENIVQ
jgi:hypothetical protein